MDAGGYNSVRPENIHPTGTNRDRAISLLRDLRRHEPGLEKSYETGVDLVAHMLAMAEATLDGAPNKQSYAIEEEGHSGRYYLLLAQQLNGNVINDLYFPKSSTSLQMIKAFTGVELDRGEVS